VELIVCNSCLVTGVVVVSGKSLDGRCPAKLHIALVICVQGLDDEPSSLPELGVCL
jgi:hypothetical protein